MSNVEDDYTITLIMPDGKTVGDRPNKDDPKKPLDKPLTRKGAEGSGLIKDMLGFGEMEEHTEIPLSEGVKTIDALEICRSFLERHKNDPMKEIEKPIKSDKMSELVGKWDADLADSWEKETLYAVLLTASFLQIPSLVDLAITKFCTIIKDKDADQVKDILGIAKDITPEEEKHVRQKSDWIYNVKPTQATGTATGAAAGSGGQ